MNCPEAPADDSLLYQLALGVAGAGGQNVFESIVRYLAATLNVDFAFVGRVLPGHPSLMKTVAVCIDGQMSDNLEYDLTQTPCREVVGHGSYYVRDGVEKDYVGQKMISAHKMTAYAGAPLNDSRGQPLGVIAVLHRGPLPEQRRVEAVLGIFAVRAATELERMAAEERLRASEEQYRAIFEASHDALILWNSRYERVDVNAAYERLYGWRRDEVVGRGFEVYSDSPAHVQPRRELVRRALAGERCRAVLERVDRAGRRIVTEVHTVPFQHRGEPHVLAIARDVTEQLQLESQLRQAQKMEAIGHLTGGIAHDFNNILTSLMGYVTLVMEALEQRGDAKLARYLERAAQSGQRARDLIQQLLTFSRGQQGEARPNFVAPLIAEAVKLLAASLPSSVVLHTELKMDLPPALVDPVQLEQVLWNLCINAADAMHGRGPLRIGLRQVDMQGEQCSSCRQLINGTHLELSVADEGTGITPEIMERMFEPFFTTKEVGKGSGMGLATVHGIVHKHRGHIAVESTPGRGTRFRVLFPALQGAAVAHSPHSGDSRPGQRAALQGRVLVVDDVPAVGEFMQDLLQEWGLEVHVENDPIAARDTFAQNLHGYDLAVLDQTMPGLTGLELAQDMLLLRPDLPVVLYTGYREALDEQAVRAVGVRALVRKPVDADALHRLLDTLLAEASTGQ